VNQLVQIYVSEDTICKMDDARDQIRREMVSRYEAQCETLYLSKLHEIVNTLRRKFKDDYEGLAEFKDFIDRYDIQAMMNKL
jgi:hypothetical protein